MAYKSKFRPKNKKKYIGDINSIICRSTWERALAGWADRNKSVSKWAVEYLVVPYYDKASGKRRRYFTDFYFEFTDGTTLVVEVKPFHETKPPKMPQRKTKQYFVKVAKYATNTSKWESAKKVCEENGWRFQVWTENHLKKLGLKIV